jgi:hypothetical protein
MKKHLENLATKFNVTINSMKQSDGIVFVEICGSWQNELKFTNAMPTNVIAIS